MRFWKETNMRKGEKIKLKVEYDKDAYTYLNKYNQYKVNIWKKISVGWASFLGIALVIAFNAWQYETGDGYGARGRRIVEKIYGERVCDRIPTRPLFKRKKKDSFYEEDDYDKNKEQDNRFQ